MSIVHSPTITPAMVMGTIRNHLNIQPTKPMRILLFYAGLLYGEFDHWPRKHEIPEVYDGGYVYCVDPGNTWHTAREWYYCDSTCALTEQVPPELRLQVLLMT
jgi:hypothetical protein